MAFCPQCGAPGTGRYCAQCGAAMPEGEAPPSAPAAAAGVDENVAAALCYLAGCVTGIIFLVLAPYNRNRTIRFHAWQSILTNAVFIVIGSVILPLLPWTIATTLGPLVFFGGFVLWLALMWKAYNRQKLVLPVIGEFAEKQA